MAAWNFATLANKNFYDGLVIHRMVPNFVVQDGDPRGDGWGGPGYAIRDEFNPLAYDAGVLGMASDGARTRPAANGSSCFRPAPLGRAVHVVRVG
jgi:peptidyl-prolyl cis-trans isomerase A (cyclophilin A)